MSSIPTARLEKWIRILGETDTEMSKIAADKLGDMKDPRAIEPLIQAMDRRTLDVSLAATRALGKIADRQAVPALINTMKNHDDVIVQQAAAEALGLIGDDTAIPAMKHMIDDYLNSYKNRYDRLHSHKRGIFTSVIRSLKQIGTREANRIAHDAESW